MLRPTLIALTAFLFIAPARRANDYEIEIDGQKNPMDLGIEKKIKLADGKTVTIKLTQNPYSSFKGKYHTFKHKSNMKPSVSKIDGGITQIMLATGLGTIVMIQEYDLINPTLVVDLMVSELTKEEKGFGYKIETSPTTKKVGSLTLTGKQAVATYKNTQWTKSVYAFGEHDAGILIVTAIEKQNAQNDQFLIDDFWKDLKISVTALEK